METEPSKGTSDQPPEQVPVPPGAGFLAAVEGKGKGEKGEVEAAQSEPRAWRGKPYPGGGQWERHVWIRGQELAHVHKAVLRCLVDHDFGRGQVNPSIATIGEETGLSRVTVCHGLRWLRRAGWIGADACERTNGGRSSNAYTIIGPPGL